MVISAPQRAQKSLGSPVVDGDTITIADVKIRLEGIVGALAHIVGDRLAPLEPHADGGATPRVRPVKVCQQCQIKFRPVRSDARYCGTRRRTRARDDRRLALAGANRRRR
jgi:hypothetical protein